MKLQNISIEIFDKSDVGNLKLAMDEFFDDHPEAELIDIIYSTYFESETDSRNGCAGYSAMIVFSEEGL